MWSSQGPASCATWHRPSAPATSFCTVLWMRTRSSSGPLTPCNSLNSGGPAASWLPQTCGQAAIAQAQLAQGLAEASGAPLRARVPLCALQRCGSSPPSMSRRPTSSGRSWRTGSLPAARRQGPLASTADTEQRAPLPASARSSEALLPATPDGRSSFPSVSCKGPLGIWQVEAGKTDGWLPVLPCRASCNTSVSWRAACP